jgi:cysteine desulfurase
MVELSSVLKAMGMSQELGQGAVRFSLGRTTTRAEIDRAAALLIQRLS